MSTPTAPLAAPQAHPDDAMRGWMAFAALIAFVGVAALFSLTKSQLQGETIGVVIGVLGSQCLGSAYQYFFGSSSSKTQPKG